MRFFLVVVAAVLFIGCQREVAPAEPVDPRVETTVPVVGTSNDLPVVSRSEQAAPSAVPEPDNAFSTDPVDISIGDIAISSTLTFASLADLLSALSMLPPDALLHVGYVGADGDVHALSEADFQFTEDGRLKVDGGSSPEPQEP